METIPLRIAYTAYKRRQQAKQGLPIACNALIANDENQMVAHSAWLGMPDQKRDLVDDLVMRDLPPSYEYDYPTKDVKEHPTAMVRQLSDSSSGTSSGSTSADAVPELTMSDSETLVVLGPESDDDDSTAVVPLPPIIRANPFSHPIAILPQYLTKNPTTLTITELDFPKLNSNFVITSSETGPDQPILNIHRERPSRSHRQIIYDGRTGENLLQVRLLRVQLPKSFFISDPEDTRIAEIQGNFSAPYTGHRSTAIFTNACDGLKTQLSIHSAWRNRRAEIRTVPLDADGKKVKKAKKSSSKKAAAEMEESAAGEYREEDWEEDSELLATMSSDWFTVRNMLGGRRSYEVQVAAGVDVTLIVALITALDQRAS